jgi:hypothetical protein
MDMSRVSGVWKGIAVIAGLAKSNMGLAADDDAVFFTSDDCTGDGYVWSARGESISARSRWGSRVPRSRRWWCRSIDSGQFLRGR